VHIRILVLPAAALLDGQPRQAVTEALERTHLGIGQGPWFQWWQTELADALRRVPKGKEAWRVDAAPGGERRERRKVVVHGRRRQALVLQMLLPGDDITLQAGARPVMPVGVPVEGEEPPELQGDFLGDFFGADASDGKLLVAFRPDGETVDGRRRGVRDKGNGPIFTFVK
jgi:hypothetical protein